MAMKSGERWRLMSDFVYGYSFDGVVDSGTSGGTLGPTIGAGQD
jgi:hypothetical protein